MKRRAALIDWLRDDPVEAEQFVTEWIEDCGRSEKRSSKPQGERALAAILTLMLTEARHSSIPTFVVDPELWQEAVLTEVMDQQDLPRLPFPVMLVQVPAGQGYVTPAGSPHVPIHDVAHDDFVLWDSRVDTRQSWQIAATHGSGVSGALHNVAILVIQGGSRTGTEKPNNLRVYNGLVNLIALLVDRQLSQVVTPDGGRGARQGDRKSRILAAQGLTRGGSTRLSLTSPSALPRTPSEGQPTGSVTAHIRRGHWRRQWVLDPAERQVLAQRERDGTTLVAVRIWVRPCVVGKGEVDSREYNVTL